MYESKTHPEWNTPHRTTSQVLKDKASVDTREVETSQREKHLPQVMVQTEGVSTTEVANDGGSVSNTKNDLDKAISAHRYALELVPAAHPNRSTSLNKLASALFTRFRKGGRKGDLDEAILLHRQALELRPPPHSLRSTALSTLASALLTRFQHGGQQDDLIEAISLHREALDLRPPPHPLRPTSLSNLANALSTRFEKGGQQEDLEDAISLHKQALILRASPHPLRSSSLSSLANMLSTRFEKGGQPGDLDEAVFFHREALKNFRPPHPLRSTSLNNLANVLSTRFRQGGQQGDLNEAISLHREALELRSPPHSLRCTSLSNLASALSSRFQQGGQRGDLDEAISLHRQALDLRPLTHPNRSSSLNNLASVLSNRFEQGGQKDDLDEAILLQRKALELIPPSHSNRSSSLNNLASVLWTRFKQDGQKSDLDEAILSHREALELFPAPHPLRPTSLNNLANALSTRFDHGGQQEDLEAAILFHREALKLLALTYTQSNPPNDVASVLPAIFEQENRRGDLAEAILLRKQDSRHFPPPHPLQSISLSNLASALSTRFRREHQQDDLNEAISLYRQALDLRDPTHPLRSSSLDNLASLLMSAHSIMSNDAGYLDHAMSLFSAATKCLSQSPSQRFRIAQRWASHANLHQHPSAIEAYDSALQILPQLAALSLNMQSRHKGLTAGSDGLARRAARCAIQGGNIEKAVEYLDAGRAVFWSQLLHLRSPVDQLQDLAPELANTLRNIATSLERGSHRDTFTETLDNRKKMIVEEEASRLARLDKEWLNAIEEVRGLDGFKDFLRPNRISSLQAAAAKYPVVILVSNDDGSHCLIMTSTNVHCIVLSNLSDAHLRNLVYLIQAAASQSNIWRSSIETIADNAGAFLPAIKETLQNWSSLEEKRGMRYKSQIPSDDIFKSVLKIVWNEVVMPVIDFLALEKSEDPPVLQWCPTGLFSFLPIHAAGCYDNELATECASDYIVSSYTPTIGALFRHNPTPTTGKFKMMVVVQSQGLPSTKMELAKIEQYLAEGSLIKLGIPGTPACVEAVASHLSDVSIAHFACHGKQDRSKPLDSGLKLEDGMLLVSRIIKEPMPNGSLAFLSACETAMGDGTLPDEAMSLAASLIFAGFRCVIATMWEMRDKDGPTIADNFYQELFRGPDGKLGQQPDTTRSAQALHVAVKKLRSENVPFRGWVPFIHMGK